MYVYEYIYVCIYVYMYVLVYTNIHVYIRAHIYVYMYFYTEDKAAIIDCWQSMPRALIPMITHVNETYHTHERIVSLTWMRHVTHRGQSDNR